MHPMPPQPLCSPQQQSGFSYLAMHQYFLQQQASFAPFGSQQQPNLQQFAQWAAYQQMFFIAQQQLAAAVSVGMMIPPDLIQAFLIGGHFPPHMINNCAFRMTAFPTGAVALLPGPVMTPPSAPIAHSREAVWHRDGDVIGHEAAKIDEQNVGFKLLQRMGYDIFNVHSSLHCAY
jgi:hypothetical protein